MNLNCKDQWLDKAALMIAIAAFVVSAISAYDVRSHNRLSTIPYLQLYDIGPFRTYTDDSKPFLGVWLQNNGAGVAVIENITITSQMSASNDISEVYRSMGLSRSIYFEWWHHETPYYLRPGESINIFKANEKKLESDIEDRSKRKEILQDLANKTKNVKIKIRYRSIYNEYFEANWPSSSRSIRP